MPKIIENLREQIIEEAKKQLFTNGYAKTTIRSVAGACGIGTGTMYNYFRSKDSLISAFMLDDWHECTGRMRALDSSNSHAFLKGIHDELEKFIVKYQFLFTDKEASKAYFSVFSERHGQLRKVIAGIIKPVCRHFQDEKSEDAVDVDFLAEHISESMLFWTLERISFDKQFSVIKLLL